MGCCGNSQVQQINKISPIPCDETSNYEKIMDKNIPNYFIEDAVNENYPTEEDGKTDQKSDDEVKTTILQSSYSFNFALRSQNKET